MFQRSFPKGSFCEATLFCRLGKFTNRDMCHFVPVGLSSPEYLWTHLICFYRHIWENGCKWTMNQRNYDLNSTTLGVNEQLSSKQMKQYMKKCIYRSALLPDVTLSTVFFILFSFSFFSQNVCCCFLARFSWNPRGFVWLSEFMHPNSNEHINNRPLYTDVYILIVMKKCVSDTFVFMYNNF